MNLLDYIVPIGAGIAWLVLMVSPWGRKVRTSDDVFKEFFNRKED